MRCFISVGVRTIFTRSTFLFSQKEILPILQQNKMIYKFQSQCDVDYIGLHIKGLVVRVEYHVPRRISRRPQSLTSGLLQSHESAIHKHL